MAERHIINKKMPEYFEGERTVPAPIVIISTGDPTRNLDKIKLALDQHVSFTISYILPHLTESNTLGYVLVIKKDENQIEASDVCGSLKFKLLSAEEVLDLIEHSAGVRYSDLWYQRLYSKRNDRSN